MRNLVFALVVILFNSCSVTSQVNEPKKSFFGDYKVLEANEKERFKATVDYKGYKKTNLDKDGAPSELPLIEIVFSNSSDSSIVLEFPFNWHPEFIKDPIYFRFEQEISENHRAELFYPNSADTAANFIRSSQHVYLDPKESLSFGAFIYNPLVESKSEKELEFSIWFRYVAMKNIKEIELKEMEQLKTYKTIPIEIK